MTEEATMTRAPAAPLRSTEELTHAATLAAVMDELAHGVVVTTLQARLVHANRAARMELQSGRSFVVHAGRLRAITDGDTRSLHTALERACLGKPTLLNLAAGPQAFIAAVVPLGPGQSGAARHVALLLGRNAMCDSLTLRFYARSHGLTLAEEQVLGVLCQGSSVPETARRLNVAASTVRTHVRGLCAKTGSNGIRELIGRVAMLPPVAAGAWLLHAMR